jgi:hypothetical protein
MLATENFTMRISTQEKLMLADIARHFQRSQSDTIKILVREVYQAIKTEKGDEPKTIQEHPSPA